MGRSPFSSAVRESVPSFLPPVVERGGGWREVKMADGRSALCGLPLCARARGLLHTSMWSKIDLSEINDQHEQHPLFHGQSESLWKSRKLDKDVALRRQTAARAATGCPFALVCARSCPVRLDPMNDLQCIPFKAHVSYIQVIILLQSLLKDRARSRQYRQHEQWVNDDVFPRRLPLGATKLAPGVSQTLSPRHRIEFAIVV